MHVWAVARDPATLVEVTKINWVSQVFCILSISTGKIAVALLISRIMAPSKWRRITLWVLCSLTMVLALIVIIVIFTQCKPGYALWDQEAGVCYNLDKTNKFDMAVASMFKTACRHADKLLIFYQATSHSSTSSSPYSRSQSCTSFSYLS